MAEKSDQKDTDQPVRTPPPSDEHANYMQYADYVAAQSMQTQLAEAQNFPSAAYLKGKKRFVIQGKLKCCSPLLGFEVIVDERYDVTHMIGSGAYGVVWSAIDKVNNEEVAIKKIQTAFNRAIDAKRILREIKILSKCVHRLTLQSSLTTKT
jgi:Protein kinase domain